MLLLKGSLYLSLKPLNRVKRCHNTRAPSMAGATGRTLFTLSLSSNLTTRLSRHAKRFPFLTPSNPITVLPRFRPLSSIAAPEVAAEPDQMKHSMLLERLRSRHLKDSAKTPEAKNPPKKGAARKSEEEEKKKVAVAGSFEELGIGDEVMGSVREMGIEVPTEIQCIGVPAVLEGKSVVLGSHTGSGKTLAYLLPLVQLLRRDEQLNGVLMKPKRPRAVVLCPTRELSEQVFRVAKSISHHARFRCTMVSGGGRIRPQEDSLNHPIDMVVGTPGRILQHIEEGNMVYGDIKYLVLDEADTMFDKGFGPDIRKFIGPLKHRSSKSEGLGFQTVLVTATMTNAVQKLVDEEFQGIEHLRTSTLHKKISTARHDFIKLSGSENKLDALLQVLEPSLAKGNRVMVFCNTLDSSRAVDHYLDENLISTVNYHGEVPAEQRVENLKKFKSDNEDCPTLVCTDLAARGLDLDVDHVVMFDFPRNSIDYLHRTGRTARMGAKGKVTSLVAKKDLNLAAKIEEAIRKNESLEGITKESVRKDITRTQITELRGKNKNLVRVSKVKDKSGGHASSGNSRAGMQSGKGSPPAKSVKKGINVSKSGDRACSGNAGSGVKSGKGSRPAKSTKRGINVSKPVRSSSGNSSSKGSSEGKQTRKKTSATKSTNSKLSVVGFRGRNSSSNNKPSSL
ncbi:DEAD-box ATP-dependent RNA helicase 39-like [Lotus japonicus]|uniref:DEAD-box ATP-dependent RNA helicase 39-like n=1 Tax=Lotus japonicus TaxID=34305 RepID=UPI00258AE623|nr:DEAD-box ATP-dependent RNA helicase 39-like [Lotus japonicus]XP_057445929.1 DEAD-box ATP-dependent RNA helicase 39-like [Lotus japonicus]